MAARLDRLHDGTFGVLIRAMPVKTSAKGRVYGGFVYAQFRGSRLSDALDTHVLEALAGELPWNQEAILAGLLWFKAGRGGSIKPESRVDSVHEVGAATLPPKDDLLRRWAKAVARPKRDV